MGISARKELLGYGHKIAQAGLVRGTGGCLSLREDGLVWIKPGDRSMGRLTLKDLCGVDLATGKPAQGRGRPPLELGLHLAIYRARPDVTAVFQAQPPWAVTVIDAGLKLKAMFAEFVNDLGRTGTLPFNPSGARAFAAVAAKFVKTHDTLFMVRRGVLAVGVTMKQAYFRIVVTEDAAKSLVAATVVGRPQYFTPAQIDEILSLDAVKHRTKMAEQRA